VPGVEERADLNRFNTIQKGAKGSIVKNIQQKLKDLKKPEFDPGSVDGGFGDQTKNAIIAFQKSQKLQADGIVGLKTWVTLLWT
jgi:lysozyme